MRELIEYIVSSLVDNPDLIQIDQQRRGPGTNFRLQVAKEDMGRVIGKQGRVANAIRILLNVAAARQGTQASLDVEDPR